jgi:hypothetical protein
VRKLNSINWKIKKKKFDRIDSRFGHCNYSYWQIKSKARVGEVCITLFGGNTFWQCRDFFRDTST